MITTRKNLLRSRASWALVVGAVLSLGSLFAAHPANASTPTDQAQQETSGNWSGYVVQSKTGKSFSNVSGSWTQPSVNSSSGAGQGYSAFWVGLGGASDQSQALEQVGTEADVINGQPTYYAWYELVPAAQQKLNLPIHPGDHMSASVNVDGTTVNISISDQTTGQSVSKTLQMSNPDTSSAEWIAEAPAAQSDSGNDSILPLADFGKVTFTQTSATADGHTGPLADPNWNPQQVDMSSGGTQPFLGSQRYFDQSGVGVSAQASGGGASTGSSADGSSFTVSYGSGGSSSSGGGGGDQSGAGTSGDNGGDPGYSYGYPGSGSGTSGDPGYGYGSSGYGDGGGTPAYSYPGDSGGSPGYGYSGYGAGSSGYSYSGSYSY